jgi:catechol 2,3-dioxygenase-like lactoylglutathione lyase family enzyme
MIEGLSHATFIVRDLERAAMFFCKGLGGTEVYDSGAAKLAAADVERLCDALTRLNERDRFFRGEIGPSYVERLVRGAAHVAG